MNDVDCLVVGAGPAGLMSALYLRRFLRSLLLVDAGRSRTLGIDLSHNLMGFPDGISGAALLQRLRGQLQAVGGSVVSSEVQALVRHADGRFGARVDGRQVTAATVLLATGVVDEMPPLDGLDAVWRGGLLRQCPICDGYEHRGQHLAVLGTGDHAAKEACFLAHYSPHVVLLDPATLARADLLPAGGVRLVRHDGSGQDFDVLYAALGVRPRAQLALALGAQTDETGHLLVDAHGRTTVSGLYAAGDVVAGLDQIAVAASQGAIAATSIHNGLPSRGQGTLIAPSREWKLPTP